jgi:hypothetical protein
VARGVNELPITPHYDLRRQYGAHFPYLDMFLAKAAILLPKISRLRIDQKKCVEFADYGGRSDRTGYSTRAL